MSTLQSPAPQDKNRLSAWGVRHAEQLDLAVPKPLKHTGATGWHGMPVQESRP